MSNTDINIKVIEVVESMSEIESDDEGYESDPCNTCGGKVEDGLAGWCGDCRDKDECRCEFCEEVKVGCETTSGWGGGYAVCMPCVREHQLTTC